MQCTQGSFEIFQRKLFSLPKLALMPAVLMAHPRQATLTNPNTVLISAVLMAHPRHATLVMDAYAVRHEVKIRHFHERRSVTLTDEALKHQQLTLEGNGRSAPSRADA